VQDRLTSSYFACASKRRRRAAVTFPA
jgi:hypothetical protein